jgi:predicted RNase H-like HicB family nuclease
MRTFTAYVEFDPATGLYVGIVPGLRGAHAQAPSLDELEVNLKEVVEMCVTELGDDFDETFRSRRLKRFLCPRPEILRLARGYREERKH